jgi:hypothetical protein
MVVLWRRPGMPLDAMACAVVPSEGIRAKGQPPTRARRTPTEDTAITGQHPTDSRISRNIFYLSHGATSASAAFATHPRSLMPASPVRRPCAFAPARRRTDSAVMGGHANGASRPSPKRRAHVTTADVPAPAALNKKRLAVASRHSSRTRCCSLPASASGAAPTLPTTTWHRGCTCVAATCAVSNTRRYGCGPP